jgi:hypothetical protein
MDNIKKYSKIALEVLSVPKNGLIFLLVLYIAVLYQYTPKFLVILLNISLVRIGLLSLIIYLLYTQEFILALLVGISFILLSQLDTMLKTGRLSYKEGFESNDNPKDDDEEPAIEKEAFEEVKEEFPQDDGKEVVNILKINEVDEGVYQDSDEESCDGELCSHKTKKPIKKTKKVKENFIEVPEHDYDDDGTDYYAPKNLNKKNIQDNFRNLHDAIHELEKFIGENRKN